jgi:hypothetical protein
MTSQKMTAAQMLLNCKGNSGQNDLLKMTFPKMTTAQMLLNCKGNSGYRMNLKDDLSEDDRDEKSSDALSKGNPQ